MKLASPDITKALLTEPKALRDRHVQFQTRVKAANEAARVRDEEAQKQNAILIQRIVVLEKELKQAKESIEVCILRSCLVSELINGCDRRCESFASYYRRSRANLTRPKAKFMHSKLSVLIRLSWNKLNRRLLDSIHCKMA